MQHCRQTKLTAVILMFCVSRLTPVGAAYNESIVRTLLWYLYTLTHTRAVNGKYNTVFPTEQATLTVT